MTEKKDPTQTEPPRSPAKRLPYERPAVISEDVFETLALSCSASFPTCNPNSKS